MGDYLLKSEGPTQVQYQEQVTGSNRHKYFKRPMIPVL